jgi:hypothetical protein
MRTICKGRDALYPVPLREGGVSKASEGRSRSKQGRGGWLLALGCWLLVLDRAFKHALVGLRAAMPGCSVDPVRCPITVLSLLYTAVGRTFPIIPYK